MEYFTLLHLQKEPFSNSPDPDMFFQSTQHQGCLQKLELAIRLRRGLSVVIGDIGTGKSTLCRQLIQRITQGNNQILPYLILDPEFTTSLEFLSTIAKTFGLDCGTVGCSEWQSKDAIKNYLFEQTIQKLKVPVLILDEGQKLPGFCVEILRELLNFETNQYKLLQIVIFAQKEFRVILKQKANFADRITTYQCLRPLNFRDTRAMIDFRLKKAHSESGPPSGGVYPPLRGAQGPSFGSAQQPPASLFSQAAILAIYCLTKGYPRRIVMLCSKVIIMILVNQNKQAGIFDVLRAAQETATSRPGSLSRILVVLTTIVIIGSAAIFFQRADRSPEPISTRPVQQEAPLVVNAPPPQIEVQPQPMQEAPPPIPVTIEETMGSVMLSFPTPSAILGSVEVERGVILSKMVARVYGRYTPQKLAMVLLANPHITTPDDIEVKTLVNFPILPNTDLSAHTNQVRLELAETPTLAEAYGIVKEYPETAPSLLIKPIMTAENVLIFQVILQEPFSNENAALERVKDLPPEWQGRYKVMVSAVKDQ